MRGRSVLQSLVRGLLLILGVTAGIVLFSSLSGAFSSQTLDDRLYVFTYEERASLEEIVQVVSGSQILNKDEHLVQVPPGQAMKYRKMFILKDGVRQVLSASSPPSFSIHAYVSAVGEQLRAFGHGDLGEVTLSRTSSRMHVFPIQDYVVLMLKTSLRYFLPGLAAGIAVGYLGAVISVANAWMGRLLDGIHALILGIPDFFLVIMLQLLGIKLVALTDRQVFKILQYGDGTPFLIPFVTIAIFPAVLVYGTLRIAIKREHSQDYVTTAWAKGLSFPSILTRHMLRNTTEDVLGVMPKVIAISLASMVIAESICNIVGIGGYYINPKFSVVTSLPATCIILGGIALTLQFIVYLLRKWLVVDTREGEN